MQEKIYSAIGAIVSSVAVLAVALLLAHRLTPLFFSHPIHSRNVTNITWAIVIVLIGGSLLKPMYDTFAANRKKDEAKVAEYRLL